MGEAKILLFAKLNYSTNSQPVNMSVPPQGGQPMLTPWGRIAKYQTYPIGKLFNSSPLSKYLAIAGLFCASNVQQVVQHLQLTSRFGGMEREEKGVLRTSPRQVVKWVGRRGQWHRISWCQRGRPLSPHQLASTRSQRLIGCQIPTR